MPGDPKLARSVLSSAPDYSIVEGLLYRHHTERHPGGVSRQLVQPAIPRVYVPRVLELHHDEITAGHTGSTQLYANSA